MREGFSAEDELRLSELGQVFTPEQIAVVRRLSKPAIRIESGGTGFSRIGGLPFMPEVIQWPEDDGKPLAFLCQIALHELPDLASSLGLPDNGFLFFFYDQEQSVWGFDPKDKPKWRVIYTEALGAKTCVRTAPEGLQPECIYDGYQVGFSVVTTWPDQDHPEIHSIVKDDDKASDAYLEFAYGSDSVDHAIGGHPNVVQNAVMELQCQLASNGIYLGDAIGYHSEKADGLKKGTADWTLLLQLDTDDYANFMWGDMGLIYFWIRKQDLQARNFKDVWTILQCS